MIFFVISDDLCDIFLDVFLFNLHLVSKTCEKISEKAGGDDLQHVASFVFCIFTESKFKACGSLGSKILYLMNNMEPQFMLNIN